ncbi:MAG: hypothetical protein ACP5DC_09965 [Halothiobacillaceae bacterium]
MKVTGVKREHFNALRRLDNLPFSVSRSTNAPKWQEFSIDDAFRLRIMLELLGSVTANESGSGLLPSFAAKAVNNAIGKSDVGSSIDAFRTVPSDHYLGFGFFEEVSPGCEPLRYSQWFCEPLDGIAEWRNLQIEKAKQESNADAQLVRIVMVNASAAAREIYRRASDLGLLDEYEPSADA